MSRLSELFEDWFYLLRCNGAAVALPSIALEIARLPYRHLRFFIVERSLTDPLPELQPKVDLQIRHFEERHLKMVREVDRPSEARHCALRLEDGHKGLVALYQNQLAGYAWGCTSIDPVIERVHVSLAPGDVMCNDAFTNPAFRGLGVQTALAIGRCKFFGALGCRRAICYIEKNNAPSLAVWQRKLGGQTTGSIDFLRVGSWYRVRTTIFNQPDTLLV